MWVSRTRREEKETEEGFSTQNRGSQFLNWKEGFVGGGEDTSFHEHLTGILYSGSVLAVWSHGSEFGLYSKRHWKRHELSRRCDAYGDIIVV